MRTFGWGLFAALVAILALAMTVTDEHQIKVQKMEHFEQVEALTMPVIVLTVSPIIFHVEYCENYVNRPAAIHGKEVLARASRLDDTFCNLSSYAVEINKYTAIEPRQRSGPNMAMLIASFNETLVVPKGGACSLARLV